MQKQLSWILGSGSLAGLQSSQDPSGKDLLPSSLTWLFIGRILFLRGFWTEASVLHKLLTEGFLQFFVMWASP